MKLIDPIDIKKQVKNGELHFYVEDGHIYFTDVSCTVIVGETKMKGI